MDGLLAAAVALLVALVVLGLFARLIACLFSAKSRRTVRRHWLLHTLWGLVAVLIVPVVLIPANCDYSTRAKVSEGFALAAEAKTAVTEFWVEHGSLPASNEEAGISRTISSQYVDAVVISEEGVITVRYVRTDLLPDHVRGRTIVTRPVIINGKLEWDCTGGDVPAKERPVQCRPRTEEAAGSDSLDTQRLS